MPADTINSLDMKATLYERAEAWRLILAARAEEAEASRKLPQDIADGLARDGLYGLCHPESDGQLNNSKTDLKTAFDTRKRRRECIHRHPTCRLIEH